MPANATLFSTLGYALAAAVFLFLAALLLSAFRGRLGGGTLTVIALVTAAWGALHAADKTLFDAGHLLVLVAEFGLDIAWLTFLAGLFAGARGGLAFQLLRYGSLVVAAALLLTGVLLDTGRGPDYISSRASGVLIFGQVFTSLVAIVLIEQIFRNTRRRQRRALKFLCLGVGTLFVYDLLMYASAVVDGQVDPTLWSARGYLACLSMPLIGAAVARSPSWDGGIFVSRKVVFHSATLVGSAIFLLLMTVIGQYVRTFGGTWGAAAQVVFVATSVLALLVILTSDTLLASMRVAIDKHFFRDKYDYREEWMRLTETLSSQATALPVRKRAIKALADIVRAPAGAIWLRNVDRDRYDAVSQWNTGAAFETMAADSPLVEFLAASNWVIDAAELKEQPRRYERLSARHLPEAAGDSCLVVPLLLNAEMLGLVILLDVPVAGSLNYEDRDLLKAAGRQVASYMAQDTAMELLAESRQFEAYNRLTAYIMHDLKNIIAQQSLVVDNAQKHRNNPEFVTDAIETIRIGVARMRRVLEQLRPGIATQGAERVDLGGTIMKSIAECSGRQPVPKARLGDERLWVKGNRDRLQMALTHLIRNAQEATPPDGTVEVVLASRGAERSVEIRDTGMGMDAEFVRDRLFRPFDSTKGTAGMGIGAYQVRETLRQMGGDLEVESTPGEGTTVRMRWVHNE